MSRAPSHTDPDAGLLEEAGLLERFMSDLVADDYESAPTSEATVQPRRARTWIALVVAAAVGIIIVAALINTRLETGERQQTRGALVDRVSALSGSVAARQAAVEQQAAAVQGLQEQLLAATDAGPARAATIGQLSQQAATTPLSGPGVTVTVDDAPDAQAGSLNRVLDRDLQDIVNSLWRAGATGIAVNGQRLTGASAIRSAGEAILVNYQPLLRPYAIAAVGAGPAAADGSGLQELLGQLGRDYGLVTDVRAGDVALPAGELRSPRFASMTAEGAGQP